MGLVRPGLGFVPKPPTSVEGASKVIVGLPAASSAAAVGVEEEKAAKGAEKEEVDHVVLPRWRKSRRAPETIPR